jgi:hypothetical protein
MFPTSSQIYEARMFDNITPMLDMDITQKDRMIRKREVKIVGSSEERSKSPSQHERKLSQK